MKRLILIVLMMSGAACAGAGSRCVVITSGYFFPPTDHKASILDLRLEQVSIAGVSMEQAVFKLAEGIRSSSKGKINFPVSTQNSRDPMDLIAKRDPQVHFDGSNVSLRKVVDTLCQQAGWSYTKTAPGYVFTDDDHFFRKPSR